MAIAGSGGWISSVRVVVRDRKLILSGYIHNVHPAAVWMPEQAAAHFLDNPAAYIYVPVSQGGGTVYLADLLAELDVIDSPATSAQLVPWTTGKMDADA